MVKDEADIIRETVGHMCNQVDFVYVADNGSTDGTYEILLEMAESPYSNLAVTRDDEVAYYQSRKMTDLARTMVGSPVAPRASWIVPFDADEIWYAREGTLRECLRQLPVEAHMASAPIFDHVATAQDPEAPFPENLPYRRREPGALHKVAVAARPGLTIHQGNHGASFEGVDFPFVVEGQLQIHHYPYRSVEQFIRKVRNGAAAYAATSLPPDAGAHWRAYGALTDAELEAHFRTWFWRERPDEPLLIGEEFQKSLVSDPPARAEVPT